MAWHTAKEELHKLTAHAHPARSLLTTTFHFQRSSLTSCVVCQRASLVCAASQTVGKFISKTPIPAFIPRQDLMDQLLRWASFEASDPDALAKFDLPIKVTPFYKDGKNQLWGMSIAFVKDGVTATTIGVMFDDEEVIRHEWVGRGSDGFPTLEGNSEDILGANLEIRCTAWGCWNTAGNATDFTSSSGATCRLTQGAATGFAASVSEIGKVSCLALCSASPISSYCVACAGKWMTTSLTTTCGAQYAASAWAWSLPSTNIMRSAPHLWTREPSWCSCMWGRDNPKRVRGVHFQGVRDFLVFVCSGVVGTL